MRVQKYADLIVQGIALDEINQLPIILLREPSGTRVFPVEIGPFEASAIIMELEGIHPPRPLTHDLLASLFTRHRFTMECLTITDYNDGRPSSRIDYRRGLRRYSIEVRPSDGLALALRLGAVIRCEKAVLTKGAVDRDFIEHLIPYTPSENVIQH